MDIKNLEQILRVSWSKESSYPKNQEGWSSDLPELGQCKVTALIVQDYFGGDILFSERLNHYWNVLSDGRIIDFTASQFSEEEYNLEDGERVDIEQGSRTSEEIGVNTKKRYSVLKKLLKK